VKLLKTLKHLFHPQRSNNHRPKFLHPKPLFFLSLMAIGFYQIVMMVATIHLPKGNILGYASNISVNQVLESTNNLRSVSGLGSLSFNNQLAQAAISKAQNMFSEGYWAHTSPTGVEPWDFIKSAGYVYKIAGENLARDFDSTPPMMDAWMNSPTHRANIMNPRYEEIGIAVVDGLLNGVETTLVVQMFGTPETQVSQPSVAVPAVASSTTNNTPTQTLRPTPSSTPKPSSTPIVSDENFNQEEIDSEIQVLAELVIPQGLLTRGILYSPQHVLKAFFLSIILILIVVLIYDFIIARHRDSVRFVGKNLAHIMLLVAVMYLIIAFRGGVVGP
jgi:hypothetical protein